MKIIWSDLLQKWVVYDDLGFLLTTFEDEDEAEQFKAEREAIEL